MVSLRAMQAHADQLCRDNEIDWHRSPTRRAYALGEIREIVAPPIRGAVSYAVVLHETCPRARQVRSAIVSGDIRRAVM